MKLLRVLLLVLPVCLGAVPSAQAQVMADQGAIPAGPVAIGVYRPEYPDDMRSLDAYEQSGSSPVALVHWYAVWGGWKAEFNRANLEVVRRRGAVPMITWEPWAAVPSDPAWSLRGRILSGQSDAYIHAWARGLAEYGGPVLLRFAHEMHNQTYPWAIGVNGNTAEDYVATWRYVHAIFVEEGATNVRWGWNPNTMAGTRRPTYEAIYRSLYPGDDVVDWVGLDIYNAGSALDDWGGWRTFAEALTDPYDALQAITSKPVILAEVGSAETGGAKADWIRAAFTDLHSGRFSAVRALVWFDIDKEERWALHSSPDALSAWLGAARGARPRLEQLA
jgi:beta-mannanase